MAQEEPACEERRGGVGAEPESEEVMRVAAMRRDDGQPVSSDGVRDLPAVVGLHTGDVGQHERELVHQLTRALHASLRGGCCESCRIRLRSRTAAWTAAFAGGVWTA